MIRFFYAVFAIYKYSTPKSLAKIFNTPSIQQIPANKFLKKIDENPKAILIDVRTPLEYKISKHPRAININFLTNFEDEIAKLDSSKTVFLYCESAHRSPYATFLLKKHGFTKIYDLKGGFMKIRGIIKNS